MADRESYNQRLEGPPVSQCQGQKAASLGQPLRVVECQGYEERQRRE